MGGWPKTLYLVKHGESTFNAYYAMHNTDPMNMWDARLSQTGEDQARNLQSEFSTLGPIPLILVSPLSRAVQTCVLATQTQAQSSKFEVCSLLAQQVDSSCDLGRPLADMRVNFPQLNFDGLQDVWWYVPQEYRTGITIERSYQLFRDEGRREPEREVVIRVDCLAEMLAGRQEEKIAIFGHGDYFNIMLRRHFARQNSSFSDYWLKDCEVLKLTVNSPEELRSPQETVEPQAADVPEVPENSGPTMPSKATLGMAALKRQVAQQNPELKPVQVLQRAAAIWKTLNQAQREQYMAMA